MPGTLLSADAAAATSPVVVALPWRLGPYARWVKPVVDRLAAAVLLLVASPLLLLTAVAVRLTLGRPVLFRQVRVGRDGVPFEVLKFRTMLPDRRTRTIRGYRPERRRTHKDPDDPRHTPTGRFLRRTSLDELPQLVNVLRGEMSLVGPRPELLHVVADYDQWAHLRHLVKPGLTGPWQISHRGTPGGDMHEHVDLDLAYVARVTLLGDLWLLLRTIPAVLGMRGE